ncbi:MAG: adenylate kinase family protein [Desulfurococcaceae archaeon]
MKKKIIVVAGTPGTGKSSVARSLREKCGLISIDLSSFAVENNLVIGLDEKRQSYIVDEAKLVNKLHEYIEGINGDVVIHTHYPEILPPWMVHKVFVLRTHPLKLDERLKARGWDRRKICENVMAEILGIVAYNVIETFDVDNMYEIETTNTTPEEVADLICGVINGRSSLVPGIKIDWLTDLPFDVIKIYEDCYENTEK